MVLAVACSSNDDQPPQSQILAASTCPEVRCTGIEAALDRLGWAFLEPRIVPTGFELHSRTVVPDSAGPGYTLQTSGHSIEHTYRFHGSLDLAPIAMVQYPARASGLELQAQFESCGEVIEFAGGEYFYTQGILRVLPTPDESLFVVCRDESSTVQYTHSVVVVSDDVFVEILAFPESGVTREGILAFVESLVPVAN